MFLSLDLQDMVVTYVVLTIFIVCLDISVSTVRVGLVVT